MAEIVLDHVSKRFPDGTMAVDDANLDIGDGELASAAGWSTPSPPRTHVDRPEIDRKVDRAAELLELTGLDRRPANLSGGQRQRVAMGRAIVRNPRRS